METIRKPFQGIFNIIRFNWHFYIIAMITIVLLFFLSEYVNPIFSLLLKIICLLLAIPIFISVCISYYIYDYSELYTFNWIPNNDSDINVINIHAGFDETSAIIQSKFPNSNFKIFDFYNPNLHTEISIKRARKMFPPYSNTEQINTSNLQLPDNSIDCIFLILAAHEIRKMEEQVMFFKEINRVLKRKGKIYVMEHLRDCNNFLAFNIGYYHFQTKRKWSDIFELSNLEIEKEVKITPFISTFFLKKNYVLS